MTSRGAQPVRRQRLSRMLWQFGAAAGKRTYVLAPFAGGSASSLAEWPAHILSSDEAAVLLEYPGRGLRAGEPPADSLSALAGEAAAELRAHVRGPLVLVGHSMGGVLCHEIAQRLEDDGRPVELLVVSAARPAHLTRLPPELVLRMTTADWLSELSGWGGLVRGDAVRSALADRIVSVVRSDCLALARHGALGHQVGCPLLVVGGSDDHHVRHEHLTAWREWTTGDYAAVSVPGGHFYFRGRLPLLASIIRGAVRALARDGVFQVPVRPGEPAAVGVVAACAAAGDTSPQPCPNGIGSGPGPGAVLSCPAARPASRGAPAQIPGRDRPPRTISLRADAAASGRRAV